MTDTVETAERTETTIKRYLCRHIHASGRRCGSPALRGEQFCFYHHPTRRRPRTAGRKPRPPIFHLPSLEDRHAIQRALIKVVSRVIGGRLDPATAGLLVLLLQSANQNTPGDPDSLDAFMQLAQMALSPAPLLSLADLLRDLRASLSQQKMYRVHR